MKILIVEDDQRVARILQLLLSSHNYAVDVAADGEAGLQMAEAFAYDLILLDVLLPKLDGITLCQQLRAKGFQSPILLLTGQGEGHQKAIALNAGADDYVVKPFDTEELIARVQALLRRGGATRQPILTFGRLSVDPSPRKVVYGTQLLSMTPKEYAILELLLRNPQKPLSAQVILDHVWNSIESPGEEAVRVHIKELRHKLIAAGAPKDLIKTIHRVGYRLNPLYSSSLFPQAEEQLTAAQIAELKAVNEELRVTLEELQTLQEELRQQNEELTETQQHLEVERQRYRDLFEMAPDGYLVTDLAGIIQDVNRAAVDLLAVEPQYLIGKPLTTFIAKADRHNFRIQLAQLNFIQNWEVRLQTRRGEAIPVMIAVTLIKNLQNEVVGLRWLLHDIQPRKQMEHQLQAAHDVLELRVAERTAELVATNQALQQQQEQWQALFDHALDAIAITDDNGCYIDANPAACQLFGVSREELLQSQIADFADPALDTVSMRQQFLQQGQMLGEFSLHRPDGTIRQTEFTAIANFIPGRHLSILRDISDRQQAMSALRRSEERFRHFAENSRTVIWIAHPTLLDNLYVNPAYEKIWGRSSQSLIDQPMSWLDAVHPDDRDRVQTKLEQQRGGEWSEIEYRIVHPDGSVRWIWDWGFPIRNEAGQIYSYGGVAEDITARKQAENELRQREEFLRSIFDGADQAVFVIDVNAEQDFHYLGFNHIAEQFSGNSAQNLLGKTPEEAYGNLIGARFRQNYSRCLTAGTSISYEEYIVFEDRILWTLTTLAPIRNEQGEIYRLVGTAIDITERKQLELSLQASQAKLSQILDNAIASITSFRVFDNRDWYYEYWSAGCEILFGYSTQELMADKALWLSRVYPDDRDALLAPLFENFFAERDTTVEYRFYHKDGSMRWISSTCGSKQIEPNWWMITAVNYDITYRKQLEAERQQTEAAIQKSEEQLRLALDLTYIGSWEWHIATGAVTWNDYNYRLLGYQPGEVEPSYQLWCKHIHPDDVAKVEQNLTQALQNRTDYSAECRVILRNGSVRWILGKGRGLYDESGQPIRMIGVAFDITDRKQAELSLQQQLQREQLIADISQDIRRSLNLENVLSRTVERVRGLLETDRVIIFRFRPDWQGDVIMESVGAEWASILSTTIFDPCFRDRYVEPYRQGRVSTLCDIEQENLEPCYVELLRPFQVKANLAVPILQGENLWGLLIAHHCSAPRQWQLSEIELLRQLATQVGIAIHQSELYEQTQQELLERERIQTVLEESEERFRTLSAAAPIGICQTNADGICLYVNERWQNMSGLSFEDSLGNGWLQAVHPDDRAVILTAWELYLQGGSDRLPEFRLLTPEGDIRWISARVATMRSATGEITGYVSADEDITERKQAEQALRESEERLHTILDNSPAIIYLLDLQNRYLLVNHSYTERLGKMPEELIGKSIYDIWPTEIADGFSAKNRDVLETGQRLQFEEVVPHDNEPRTYITAKFPLCDATGAVYAICGISTDITEKKYLEAQVYRAQRMESLGTLASGIAHDLNNCLTPILAIAQLLRLKQPNLDVTSQEMLKVLEDSAKRGANMVKQILTFAKGTNGDRVSLQVASLLQDVINVIQQTFPKLISIRQDIPDLPLGPVSADPTHLHQVLLNLCVNARDAMPNGGTLTLSAKDFYVDELFAQMNLDAKVGHYVVVTVADTGTGIAADVRDRIFDPFFTTKAVGQGIGLGLSTALGIVKSYGGFMQVFSQVGRGSQFKVYLPVMQGSTPAIAQAEALLHGNGELVLIVDDDPAVQHTNQSLLESHRYTTLIASDGLEAIDLYTQQQQQIKVVLIDMMMPNMDGTATIRALHDINPDVKVIAISGLSANQDAALAAGADAFLSKPYTLEDLLRRLHKLIKDAQ